MFPKWLLSDPKDKMIFTCRVCESLTKSLWTCSLTSSSVCSLCALSFSSNTWLSRLVCKNSQHSNTSVTGFRVSSYCRSQSISHSSSQYHTDMYHLSPLGGRPAEGTPTIIPFFVIGLLSRQPKAKLNKTSSHSSFYVPPSLRYRRFNAWTWFVKNI